MRPEATRRAIGRARAARGLPCWTRSGRRALCLLWVLASLGWPSVAFCQTEKPAESKEAEAAPEPPKTVPISDVGVESERAKRRLGDSRKIVEPGQVVDTVAESIPGLRAQVDAQVERSEALRAANPSVLALDRLQKEWGDIESNLEDAQSRLRGRGGQIDKQVERIRETRTLWTATRKRAIELEVSEEVVVQIDEVLAVAQVATKESASRQAFVLGLQSDVASLSERAAADLNQIAGARNDAVGEIFQRDVPPLVSPEFWQQTSLSGIGTRLAEQERREEAVLVEYWNLNRERVIAYLIMTALLVVAVRSSQRRILARLDQEQTTAGDPEAQAAIRAIFSRPTALALLIAFFTGLWVFEEMARTLEPLFGALTLIPAVIVLRQIVDRPLFPLLNLALSVYFVHHIHELLAPLAVVSRLLFLAEMAALALFAANTLRPSRLAEIPKEVASSTTFRMVGQALRITLAMSVVAFLAEVSGYGALANLVGGTLVLAIYAAIVLYGTLRVADSLVAIALRVRPLRLLGMVRNHRWLVRKRIRLGLQLVAWFIWIRACLRSAELWDDVERAWQGLLEAEIPLPEISITLGHLMAAIAVFWGALLFSRFLRFALAEDVFARMNMAKGRPYAISTLLHYSVAILGFVLAAAALGFDANRATLLTGAFGVGIGFGLQTIVNNFISGIILLTEQPIQVGDTIAMGEIFGEVQRIGIRSSTVRTWQGAEVIVPNADLISQQVINWTLSDRRRRMEIPVGVTYGSDPPRVIEALERAASECEDVLRDPAPYVLFKGFGESSLDFELRAWTDDFDNFQAVRSQVCVGIATCLAEAGLEVPFPQRDLHLKTMPGEALPVAATRGSRDPDPA